jgi:hypothetical protein
MLTVNIGTVTKGAGHDRTRVSTGTSSEARRVASQSRCLPLDWFIDAFVRREAVLVAD